MLLHKTDTELRAEAFYKEEMEHTHCPGLGLPRSCGKEQLSLVFVVPFKQNSWYGRFMDLESVHRDIEFKQGTCEAATTW